MADYLIFCIIALALHGVGRSANKGANMSRLIEILRKHGLSGASVLEMFKDMHKEGHTLTSGINILTTAMAMTESTPTFAIDVKRIVGLDDAVKEQIIDSLDHLKDLLIADEGFINTLANDDGFIITIADRVAERIGKRLVEGV